MDDSKTFWERRIATYGRHRSVGTNNDTESVNRARKEALFDSIRTLVDNSRIEGLGGMELLDAGCGTGIYADYLAERGGDVHAFDFSRAAVGRASETDTTVSYTQGTVTDIPYRADRFDISFCLSVLYHLVDDEDWTAAIRELCRVIKPGGHLVLRVNWEERRFGDGDHFQERPRSEYLSELSDHGFELRDVVPIVDAPRYPSSLPLPLKRALGPIITTFDWFDIGRNRLLLFSDTGT